MKRIWNSALVFVMLIVGGTVSTAETGMKTVVTVLETRYSVRHHGVPGLWLAKPFLFVSGLGSLKMAVFGNFRPPAGDTYVLKESVEQALGPEWSPFVETWSKTDGESTVIFAKTVGDGLRMLIVSSDREDGLTLLQVGVSGRAVRLWLDEPSECVERVSGRRSKDRNDNELRQAASHVSDSSQSSSPAFRPPSKLGER
jgi:hypothetical protein